jgi:hypothetical protein
VNWKAIGIGVGVGVGCSLLMGVLFRIFPFDASAHPLWIFMLLSYGAGALIDIATGATAGALARTRGALHGLLAGAIALLLSPLIGYAMMWVETRGEPPIDVLAYAFVILVRGLVGVALATAAGAVAAYIARTQAPASA